MNYLVNDHDSYQLPQQSKRVLKIAKKSAKQNKIEFNVKDMLDFNNGNKRKQLNIQRKREHQRIKEQKYLQAKKEQKEERRANRHEQLKLLRAEMKRRDQYKFKSIEELKEEQRQLDNEQE